MAMVSSLSPNWQGLVCPRIVAIHPNRQSHIPCPNWRRLKSRNGIQLLFERSTNDKVQHRLSEKYPSSGGGNHYHLTVDDDYDQQPFWSDWIEEAFRAMKSLLIFLAEQPSQLKHIEWPSFQSTVSVHLSLTLVISITMSYALRLPGNA